MIFYTESQSAYEVDLQNKRVRRLRGAADPTPRQGKDGEWKEYTDISPIVVGLSVAIFWAPPSKISEKVYYVPATETNLVKYISSDEN
jgi:hypothetical protein